MAAQQSRMKNYTPFKNGIDFFYHANIPLHVSFYLSIDPNGQKCRHIPANDFYQIQNLSK